MMPARWDMIHTTDLTVRSEMWARLLEEIASLRAPPPGFRPERPWDYIIAASAFGSADARMAGWWQSHLVLPLSLSGTAGHARETVSAIEGGAGPSGLPRPPPRRRKL